MKIGIIGATGHVGQGMVAAALKHGDEVTALVRNEDKAEQLFHDTVTVVAKDALALTREDLSGLDAVIDSFASPKAYQHLDLATHLISMYRDKTAPYLMFIIGASSLHDADGKLMLTAIQKMAAGAPWIAAPEQQVHEFDYLKWVNNVAWTAITPQQTFTDNPATQYRLGGDTVMSAPNGESEVSVANFADAAIDELARKQYIRQRFSVVDA
ncbi:NAD(P)H-binding protein [Lacticaseibacillus pabuli]|uniref:NAD(P)H-binding protein n=1 Tax=Lacticaseibacillus pabuli TaxID=3025672 RepID=A0ABY7WNF3_9LACO|nr:NAD(P)H-binding protein [Lacticaseibacillus sp. KACC 23028]WDF81720.1 NAD(P)H-binding protein [Lacticaseibacillus sp. KACC 23028]